MDKFVISKCNFTSNKKQKLLKTQSEDVDELVTSNENSKTSTNCYIFDGQLFCVVKDDDKNISAQCQMCSKIIQAQKGSTGNFLSHIKVCINCI